MAQLVSAISEKAIRAINKYSQGSSRILEKTSECIRVAENGFDTIKSGLQIAHNSVVISGIKTKLIGVPINLAGGVVSFARGVKTLDEVRRHKAEGSEVSFGFLDILLGILGVGATGCETFSEMAQIFKKVNFFSKLAGSVVDYAFLGTNALTLIVTVARLGQAAHFQSEIN